MAPAAGPGVAPLPVADARLQDATTELEEARSSGEPDRLTVALARYARALESVGHPKDAISVLEGGLPAPGCGERAGALFFAARAWVRYRLQQYEGATEDALEALAAFEVGGTVQPEVADCHNTIASVARSLLRPDEAAMHYQRGLEAAMAAGALDQELRLLCNFALLEIERGHLGVGLDLARRALGAAELAQEDYFCAVARLRLGLAYFYLGRLEEAEEQLSAAATLSKQLGATLPRIDSLQYLAWVRAELGRFDQALANGTEAVALAQQTPSFLGMASMVLAEVHLLADQPEQARALVAPIVATAHSHHPPERYMAQCIGVLGRAELALGNSEEGLTRLAEAVSDPAFSIHDWENVRLLRITGECEGALGHSARGLERLERARSALLQMGATRELRKAEAAIAALRDAPPKR